MVRFARWPWIAAGSAILIGGIIAVPYLRAWHHWRWGNAALAQHQTAQAREHFEAYLRLRPKSIEARLLAARAARQDGDLEAAQAHLRECQRQLQGTTPETTFEWSLLRATGGDLDEVEGYLQEQARADASRAPLVMEALCQGYARVYRVRDALACFDAWLAFEPDNVQALFLRGNLWRQVQAWTKAAPDYQRALDKAPQRDDVRWWLAVSLQELGRNDEALSHLEALRPRRPEDMDLTVRMARCYKGLLRLDEARTLLDQVVAERPDQALALRSRGEVELAAGDQAAAEQWLRRAVAAAPGDYRAQFALGQCLQRRPGHETEARQQQQSAERLKQRLERLTEIGHHLMSATPHDANLHAEMGALLVEVGEREAGRRWFLSAVKLSPECKAAHAALAEYYRASGDAEQAERHRLAALSAATSAPSGSARP